MNREGIRRVGVFIMAMLLVAGTCGECGTQVYACEPVGYNYAGADNLAIAEENGESQSYTVEKSDEEDTTLEIEDETESSTNDTLVIEDENASHQDETDEYNQEETVSDTVSETETVLEDEETISETETTDIDIEKNKTEAADEIMQPVGDMLLTEEYSLKLNQSKISLYETVSRLEQVGDDSYVLRVNISPQMWVAGTENGVLTWKVKDAETEQDSEIVEIAPYGTAKFTTDGTTMPEDELINCKAVLVKSKSLNGAREPKKAIVTAAIVKDDEEVTSVSCEVTVMPLDIDAADLSELGTEEILNGIWMAGFKETVEDTPLAASPLTYTGTKITQNIRLYDRRSKLTEGVDYSIVYKNNINACDSKALNSPSMTINMKGQYSGSITKYFKINRRNIADVTVKQENVAYISNGKLQKYVPQITLNGRKLNNNKDFTIEYYTDKLCQIPATNDWAKQNKNDSVEVFYKVEGIGNYYGECILHESYTDDGTVKESEYTGSYRIAPKSYNVANAQIKYTNKLQYDGNEITAEALNITLKMSGESAYTPLSTQNWNVRLSDAKGTAVDVVTAPGNYSFVITPSDEGVDNGYTGQLSRKFTVSAAYHLKDVAAVTSEWQKTIAFDKSKSELKDNNGKLLGMRQPVSNENLLQSKGDSVEITGNDYDVIYSNNTKVGTAKVTFKGKGRCDGSFSQTFKITAGTFDSQAVTFVDEKMLPQGESPYPVIGYSMGGASPKISVSVGAGEETVTLVANKDYTVAYSNNKAVTTLEKLACVTVKGKGNYAGCVAKLSYAIAPANIGNCRVVAADKAAGAKANDYMTTVTVYDPNGKKLTQGIDYKKLTIEDYTIIDTPGMDPIVAGYDNETSADMDPTGDTANPQAGTYIKVTITGIGAGDTNPDNYNGTGNYVGQVTGTYHLYDKSKTVSKLQIAIDQQVFEGCPVEPTPYKWDSATGGKGNPNGAIHVYLNAANKKAGIETEDATKYIEVVSYSANGAAGTGKVTLKGVGEYGGTRTVNFKIWDKILHVKLKETQSSTAPKVTYNEANQIYEVTFAQGGVTPETIVTAGTDTTELINKKDYTISYSGNKAVSIDAKKAIVTVKGKGVYAKCEPVQLMFNVVPASIAGYRVEVADRTVSTKANDYMSPVTVYDINGKKLTQGKDYKKLTIEDYTIIDTPGMDPTSAGYDNETYAGMDPTGDTGTPKAGTYIKVTVTGIGADSANPLAYNGTGNYVGQAFGIYHLYDKNTAVSKLQIAIDPQLYTGKPIEPTPYNEADGLLGGDNPNGAIHVYLNATDKKAGREVKDASKYIAVEAYSANIKAGTASVTLHGLGEYGGTRKVSFKITKKSYATTRVSKVVINPDFDINTSEDWATATLTATVEPANAANKTLIWSSSNSKVVRIDSVTQIGTDGAEQSMAKVTFLSYGKATIKAVAQDNGKSASININLAKPKSMHFETDTVNLTSGETKQLKCLYDNENLKETNITWTSANPMIATVDEEGMITANHAGATQLAAYDNELNFSATCTVYVTEDIGEMLDITTMGVVANLDSENNTYKTNVTKFENAIMSVAKCGVNEGKTIYVPAGTYYFAVRHDDNNSVRISEVENVSIVLDSQAILRAHASDQDDSRVVWIDNSRNVSITGGTVIGDVESHIYSRESEDEHGYGISVVGSDNVFISNMHIRDCCGDGIYIGTNQRYPQQSTNVHVVDCTIEENHRHDISLTASENVEIRNCSLINTKPHGCMDIEANDGRYNKHVRINNCTFSVGGGAALAILNDADDIVLTDTLLKCNSNRNECYIENRSGTHVYFNGIYIRPNSFYDP